MARFKVSIEGRTPLLMHYNNLEARDAVQARGRQGGKAGDDRTPADTWKASVYVDEKNVVVPAECLLAALMWAGKKISIGKMQTLKAASQSILFDDFFVPLLIDGETIARADIEAIDGKFPDHCKAARDLGFSLFVKPATVNGKSHVRVRPRFDRWALVTGFETDDDDLLGGSNRIESLFDGAGKSGLGDWRPSAPKKPGMYGMFRAQVTRL